MQTEHNTEFSGLDELLAIDQNLKNYNNYIVGLFVDFLANSPLVVDFGAGIGTLSEIFRAHTGRAPVCVEIDDEARAHIERAGLETRRSINEAGSEIDGVFTSNVLEHIQDDEAALRDIYQSLKSGGKVAIYVPAFMRLFSDMDRKVGHYRRYEKKELIEKVRRAGFAIDSVSYVDSIGFIASLLLVLKAALAKSAQPQMPVSARTMKFYDRFIFPASRLLDFIGFRFLFGKNLYLQAVKR